MQNSAEKKKPKQIIAYINAENETAESVLRRAEEYERNGADGLFLYNYTVVETEQEEFLHTARQAVKQSEFPVLLGCRVRRFEDIKKALYTGAAKVVMPFTGLDSTVLKEGAGRFGSEKLVVELDASGGPDNAVLPLEELAGELAENGAGMLLVKHLTVTEGMREKIRRAKVPLIIRDSLLRNDMETLLSMENVDAVATDYYEKKDIFKIRRMMKEAGIDVETPESPVSFAQLKKNADGLVPVIVQDYKNDEVLMLAYMNEEAYNKTIETGRMTYYSRSRQKLWLKGEESGHFQYVKSLSADCDSDTLLAKVLQIGAACHTGSRSCFFRKLFSRPYEETNPGKVLNEVFGTILERRSNPKEGSYTSYLFDKGIDKILKKCGEEATEIVIAAKNPDSEEVKYEMADFLYHMMVLMAECGLDWEDISRELLHRH